MAEPRPAPPAGVTKLPISGRKLESWIDTFFEFTAETGSADVFRRWVGISILAGALERRVWLRTKKGALYPHLYVLLVGPPGVGKTMMTMWAWDMWHTLEKHHMSSIAVSGASLIDDLKDAERHVFGKGMEKMSFNSMKVSVDELSVIIPAYDDKLMGLLTAIYDARPYTERKRTKELRINIQNPQINMLAGTTPSYLNGVMPPGAWDQGFISRVIMVYNGENTPQPIFGDDRTVDTRRRDALIADLARIGADDFQGEMKIEPEAIEALNAWSMRGGEPKPQHPKLSHYNTRRGAHLLKLCMVSSVSRGSDLVITLDDFRTAYSWLTEAEAFMPDIFKAMASGGDGRVMEDTWYHAYTLWMKDKKPLAEMRLVAFLAERTPAHNVARILEVMVKMGIFKESDEKGIGKCYTPRPMKQV